MEKSSNRKQAYESLTIIGAKPALIYILEEFVKEAEANVLESPSLDPKLAEKLTKAQDRRFILEIIRKELK